MLNINIKKSSRGLKCSSKPLALILFLLVPPLTLPFIDLLKDKISFILLYCSIIEKKKTNSISVSFLFLN